MSVVTFIYQGQAPVHVGVSGSLKLAQELPEQAQLTVADVATIIDDMHGVVDPCLNIRDNNSYYAAPEIGTNLKEHQQSYLQSKYSSEFSLENLAAQFGGSCLVKQGKPIKLVVYAFWTSEEIGDNYKLICPVGRIDNQRRVQSRLRLRIEVSNADSVDFSYFVIQRKGFPPFENLEWIGGNIVDRYGRSKAIPAPEWDGLNTLYWSEVIRSGHIFVEFDTLYDRWDVTLQGVWTDGKRDYNASVTGIWDGAPVSLKLDVPDAGDEEASPCTEIINAAPAVDLSIEGSAPQDDGVPSDGNGNCYQITITDYYHPCTGYHVRDDETQVPAPCDGDDDLDGPNPPVIYKEAFIGVGDPAFDGGTDCGGPCTPEGYEDICCRTPDNSSCVPTCLKWHSKNQGGLLPAGGLDALKQEYGDDVQVIWVYPDDGDCGEHIDRLELPGQDCCISGDIIIDTAVSAETVAPNSSAFIAWNYGENTVTVEITGQGFWLDAAHSLTTITQNNTNGITIYTDSDNCGTGIVTIDDGCSSAEWGIRSTSGEWVLVDSESISPGTCGEGEGGMGQTQESSGCIDGGEKITRTWCAVYGWSNCEELKDSGLYYHAIGCDGDYPGSPGTGKVFCFIISINTYNWQCP